MSIKFQFIILKGKKKRISDFLFIFMHFLSNQTHISNLILDWQKKKKKKIWYTQLVNISKQTPISYATPQHS